jgi:tetratricopeptide (TPR) repeat protein
MDKNNFFFAGGGLILGLIIGFFVANSINRSAISQQTTAQNTQNAPVLPQQQSVAVQSSQNGMMPQVAETLEKAKNEPNNFEAQTKAGDMYAQIQKFDKAIEFYEQAHRINLTDYDTIVKIGNAYFDMRRFEDAEKWYAQALEKNPDDVNVRTDLGTTFVERKNPDFDRAVKEFQISLQKNPRHEPTLYNLGVAYFKKGDSAEAQKTLRLFESINPQSELMTRLRQVISVK